MDQLWEHRVCDYVWCLYQIFILRGPNQTNPSVMDSSKESGLLSVWFLKECTSKNIMHYYACQSFALGWLYHVFSLVVLFNAIIIMGPSVLGLQHHHDHDGNALNMTSPRHVKAFFTILLTKHFTSFTHSN
jgi:hypothetical protein